MTQVIVDDEWLHLGCKPSPPAIHGARRYADPDEKDRTAAHAAEYVIR